MKCKTCAVPICYQNKDFRCPLVFFFFFFFFSFSFSLKTRAVRTRRTCYENKAGRRRLAEPDCQSKDVSKDVRLPEQGR